MNIVEFSIQSIETYGEYKSLNYEGRWFTNVELDKRSRQIAVGLCEIGVKHGDRVAMVLGNCPEVINTFYACFRIGAWAMPVLFTLSDEEIGYVLHDAGAKVVITDNTFLEKVKNASKSAPSVCDIVMVDPDPVEGTHNMQSWFRNLPADFPYRSCKPDDTAVLMYTSGTTGDPKGVMISHNNLYTCAMASAKSQKMEKNEMGISALPLNHIYGIITSITASKYALRGVYMTWFDAEKMLELIDKFKCQATGLVPAMLIMLLNYPDAEKYDTSHMKRWICSGAPLSVEIKKRFEERFSGKVLEAYGCTECSPTVTVNRLDQTIKDGSVGLPLDILELSIRDPLGEAIPTGDIGEICVKGPNVMLGYYNRPEETAMAIRDNWLYTGDAGYLDEDGYLFLTERMKDLIIRGGENVFPKDIEHILIEYPQIAEVAVIGMPHEVYGEEVMAIVAPMPGTDPSIDEITEYCEKRLGKFQVPKRIEFVEELPKNLMGKVLKKNLRKYYFS